MRRPGGGAPRRTTLKDVALIAGVDPSLVSRVINGDERLKITPETHERVLAAVERAGYTKNLVARGLRIRKTGLIACVVPDLTTPSYAETVAGAQKQARAAGYSLLVVPAPDDAGSASEYRRLLDEQRVDGLIVGSGVLGDRQVAGLAEATGPIVVFNRLVEGAECAVVVDDEAASRLAARHLRGLGHSRCAILAGPEDLETTQRRWRGFDDGLREGGGRSPTLICSAGWDAAAGYDAARELFAIRPRPTAVYSASGVLHIGLLAAAAEQQVDVPGEMSVIAFNDSQLNRFTTPPVTAIKMPLAHLGATAVNLLMDRIAGRRTPSVRVIRRPGPKLIVRASCRSID
jgi:LacI family transcriptional regulator